MKSALGMIEVVIRHQSQFRARLFHSPKLIDPLLPLKSSKQHNHAENLTYTRKSKEQENLSDNYLFIYSGYVLLALPIGLWPEPDAQLRPALDQVSD